MKVYNIKKETINKFTSLLNNSSDFKETVQGLWEKELSSPEWCFVIEEKGKLMGRVGYWASKDEKENIRIFGLLLPWERKDTLSIGKRLLNESIEMMKKQGAKTVNYQLHSDEKGNLALKKELLETVGMENIQKKKSFYLEKNSFNSVNQNRLTYKSLEEIGEEKFIGIIKKVTRETLDKEDELSVLNFGAEEHARNHFNDLKSIDFSPENWFIAYNKNNIIGLVIPQKFNNKVGAINYIGVISEERGQGYVIDLLDKGIKNLFERDVSKIIADIDVQNFPMENALLKSGFNEEKKIYVYDFTLKK